MGRNDQPSEDGRVIASTGGAVASRLLKYSQLPPPCDAGRYASH